MLDYTFTTTLPMIAGTIELRSTCTALTSRDWPLTCVNMSSQITVQCIRLFTFRVLPESLPGSGAAVQLTCQIDICKRVTPPCSSPCAREVALCRITLHKCMIGMLGVCTEVLQL